MSVAPLNNTVISKADKTAVVIKPKVEVPKETVKKPEADKSPHTQEHEAHIDHKASNCKVKHSISLVEEKPESHESHGPAGKLKEEAVVKLCEKTGTHAVEHIAAKTLEKAVGQAVVTAGIEAVEKGAKRYAPTIVQKSSKVLAKGLAKIETNATGKAITGTFKAIGHGMEHGLEKSTGLVVKVVDKVTASGASKLGAKVIEKVGAKAAGRMAAFVPVAGVAVGAYITKLDHDDYKAKMKDPTVTKTSKVLAGVTVGLDVVSTGASALAAGAAGTVIGAPVAVVAEGVSWAATGLSILTSAGSEIFKHSGNHKGH